MNSGLAFFKQHIGKSFKDGPSAVGRWLAGTIKEVEEGQLVVEFTVRDDMTNPMATLHGGAAAAMMDDMIGMMILTLGREYAYTSINLNCDFLNPARVGDVLIGQAEVIRAGRNVIHCECRLRNAETGKIIAKATSNMAVTPIKMPMM